MDNLWLLDDSFDQEYIVDDYESLIWTMRYKEPGDFELYLPLMQKYIDIMQVGKFLLEDRFYFEEADNKYAYLMIIETIEIDEQHMKVTGRSLESILDRRIVWNKTKFEADTPVITALITLIDNNIVSPEEDHRQIENFVFTNQLGEEWGTIEEEVQYEGNTILDVVGDFCEKYKIGYEVVFNYDLYRFEMSLVKERDLSYGQTDYPPVIFSASLGNLKSSKYIESSANYKNVAFVAGERFNDDQLNVFFVNDIAGDNTLTGLERRETYIDSSSVVHEDDASNLYGDNPDPDGTYRERLRQYGLTELNKKDYAYENTYEGEMDPAANAYQYHADYRIGDIAEIVTSFGGSAKVRVSEIVLSISASGITFIPTFESVNKEDES